MGMRRFTRLTNAFSKKWENHWAAVRSWFAYYNFCRIHKITPRDSRDGSWDHRSRVGVVRIVRISSKDMTKTVVCRYCGDSFALKPGKPGFVDECTECLHEKTTPKQKREPKIALTPESEQRMKELRRSLKALRKQLTKMGYTQDRIDRVIRVNILEGSS